MRKSTFIKRLVALFLVVLMSINTFAAVVGDNDGAAFITKGEFDSMKNDFQSQLDRYNTSIDNKIDGAIASYLAGVTIAKTSVLLDYLSPAYRADVNNVSFANWRTPQATADPVDAYGYWWYAYLTDVNQTADHSAKTAYGWFSLNNYRAWAGSGSWIKYTNYTGNENNFISKLYYARFPWGINDQTTYQKTGNLQDWALESIYRYRCTFRLKADKTEFTSGNFDLGSASGWPNYIAHHPGPVLCDYTLNDSTAHMPSIAEIDNGTWYHVKPMTLYCTIAHTWSMVASSDSTNNKFLLFNIAGNISNTTSTCVDYDYRDYYVSGTATNVPIQASAPQTGSAGGYPGDSINIYHGSDDATWAGAAGQGVYNNNIVFRFKWNTQKKYNLYWNRLTSSYWNGIFSEPYYKYYGVPICRTTKNPGQLKLKLKFTSKKLSDNTNNQSSYRYQIMDKKFPNAAMPSSDMEAGVDHVLKRAQVNAGNPSYEVTLNLEKSTIWDTSDGDYIYIKVEPSDADQYVIVETTDSIEYTEAA